MSDGQYTITMDHERGIVYVIAKGEFNKDLGDELITDARTKAADHQFNIICNVKEVTLRVAFADWFFLPRRLGVYRNAKTRSIKTALVVTAGKQEKVFQFFETVTSNLGMNIRVFIYEEDALIWLRSVSSLGK